MTSGYRATTALLALVLVIGVFAGPATALSATPTSAVPAATMETGDTKTLLLPTTSSASSSIRADSKAKPQSNDTDSHAASSSDVEVVVHNFSADRTTRYPADAPVEGGSGSENTGRLTDDRVWVRNDTAYAPWDSEFSPIVWVGDSCTGALVDEYHVLTSAHCVYDSEAQRWEDGLSVSPGAERVGTMTTEPYGTADVVLGRAYAPFIDSTDPENDTQAGVNDMALLTIDRPLGSRAGTLDFAYEGNTTVDSSVYDGARVDIAGYPGQPPKASAPYPTQWWDHGESTGDLCEPASGGYRYDCWERALSYDVYTSGGQSGSPVLHNPPWATGSGFLTREAVILAVASYGDLLDDGQEHGWGPRITPTRSEHIESWIATDDGATAGEAFAYRASPEPALSFASVATHTPDQWYDWGRMSPQFEVINGTQLHYEHDVVNVGTAPFSGTVTVEFQSSSLSEFTKDVTINSLSPGESVPVTIEHRVNSGVGEAEFGLSLSSPTPVQLTNKIEQSLIVRETGDAWYGQQYGQRLTGYNPHTIAPRGPSVTTDWTVSLDDPVFTGVAVRNGTAYAVSENGTVYAINTSTGSVAWTTHVGAPGTRVGTSAVAVGHGNLYVGVNNFETNATVYAINTTTHRTVWSVNGYGFSVDGITPIAEDSAGNRHVYVNANGGFTIDSQDGTVFGNHTSITRVQGAPAAGPTGKFVVAQGDNITSYFPFSWNKEWTINLDTTVSGVTVGDEFLFVRDSEETLYGLDYNSKGGRVIWTFAADDSWVPGVKPVVVGGRVIIGDENGTVYARRGGNGTGVWRTTLPTNGSVLDLVGADRTIYATTEDGKLFAVDTDDGSVLWEKNVTERHDLWASPVVVDGRVIVPTAEGNASRVVAFRTSRPTPAFEYTPGTPISGETVTFDASSATAPAGKITSYAWDFDGDGETDATGVEATHTFADADQYPVTLTITTDGGVTNTTTRTVTVGGRPPEARFDNGEPVVGKPTLFNASSSSDPDGNITSYEWDFDGDSTIEDTGVSPGYTFETPGERTVSLTVTDNEGFTDTIERVVRVRPLPFRIEEVETSNVSAGDPVTVTPTIRNTADGITEGPVSVTIPGVGEASRTVEVGVSARPTFSFPTDPGDAGTYRIKIRTGNRSRDVPVRIRPPPDLPGSGTRTDPYLITNGTGLREVNNDLTANYILGSDIDVAGVVARTDGNGIASIGFGGYDPFLFRGTFDGAGHAINGLTIERSDDPAGLFYTVASEGVIKDVTLSNVDVASKTAAGGIAARNRGTILNVTVTGTVTGNRNVGGVAGRNGLTETGAGVIDSTAHVTVSGKEHVGGLVGSNPDSGKLLNSTASGAVTGNTSVGGAVGSNEGTVIDSSASGLVDGNHSVGGLIGDTGDDLTRVGSKRGTVIESSASGSVNGIRSVGGLVGLNGGNITDSTATGNVSASGAGEVSNIGGLVGRSVDGIVRGSTARGDIHVTGPSENIGGLIGLATAGPSGTHVITNSLATGQISVSNGGSLIGGLVGDSGVDSAIRHSLSRGDISAESGTFVGGLVGYNRDKIRESAAVGDLNLSSGTVVAQVAGGLVGRNSGGSINATYARGNVTGPYRLGGLVGTNYGTISNSYATGTVSGTSLLGGLVGARGTDVSDSYWDTETTGQSTSEGGTGLTTVEMIGTAARTNMDGLEFGTIWRTRPGDYPELLALPDGASGSPDAPLFTATIDSTTTPVTAGDTLAVTVTIENHGENGSQTVELRFNGTQVTSTTVSLPANESTTVTLAAPTNLGDLPALIIDVATANGTTTRTVLLQSPQVNVDPGDLSGNGTPADPYVITNVSELQAMEDDLDGAYRLGSDINASSTAYWNDGKGFNPVGQSPLNESSGPPFTGRLNGEGHTIMGLNIDRPEEDSTGIFGAIDNSTVEQITLRNVTVTGANYVGGLAGRNTEIVGERSESVIENVSASVNVSGETGVGGLVGHNGFGGTIQTASVSGNVTGSRLVGGFAGLNSASTIRIASASGSVTGSGEVGGLVGSNGFGSTIRNAVAFSSVNGTEEVGGLAGTNGDGSTIREAFAAGNVSGSSEVGGLVGGTSGSSTVTLSYWNKYATNQASSAGSATPLTTAQMTGKAARTNMTGLAFGSVWQTRPDDYPILGALSDDRETTTCIADAVSGSDDTISLAEIQAAINWWAEGKKVPDTGGQTISLTRIQSLINTWATGDTVSCS